jgi:transcriptional regulator with XRE-family HTH domain
VRTIVIGRVLRMLRIRKGWRQEDVASKANVSPSAVGRHERGWIGSLTAVERHAAVFGMRVEVRLVGRAGELVRLADDEHAAITELLVAWFRQHDFVTEPEASFSEWGERGRIDLLAYDPRTGILVVVEVKTQLLDLQDLFGGLNAKLRLSSTIAGRHGWQTRRTAVVLAVADTAANRAVVRAHPALFDGFEAGRLTAAAIASPGARLLRWIRPVAASRSSWIAGRQRVRRSHLNRQEVALTTHRGTLAAAVQRQLPSPDRLRGDLGP